jgi:hypothetical protein
MPQHCSFPLRWATIADRATSFALPEYFTPAHSVTERLTCLRIVLTQAMERPMKTLILSGLTAVTIFAGAAAANAQTVIITQEQQPVIREYVVRQKVAPVAAIPDYDFAVGTVVPDVVEVRPLEVPELTNKYEYVVTSSGQTVLVEPGTRRVVQIVD